MSRFSRLRRSAGLLLLTAGFCGLSADSASADGISEFAPPSTSLRMAIGAAQQGGITAHLNVAISRIPGAIRSANVELNIGLDNVQLPTFAFTTVTSVVSWEAICAMNAEAAGMESSRYLMKSLSPIPMTLTHIGADGFKRTGIDFEHSNGAGKTSIVTVTPRIIISEEEEDSLLSSPKEIAPAAPQTLSALIMAQGGEGARKFFGIPSGTVQIATAAAEQTVASCYQGLLEMPFSLDKILTLEVETTPLQEAGIVAKEQPVLRMSALTQERMMRHFAPAADDSAACPVERMAVKCQPGIIRIHPETKMAEQDYEFLNMNSWQQLSASRADAPAANPLPDSGIEPIGDDFVQHLPPRGDVPTENPPAIAASRTVSPTMSPLEYAENFLTQDERRNLPIGTKMLVADHNALTGQSIVIGNAESEDEAMIVITRSISKDEQIQQTAHTEPSTTSEPSKACTPSALRALGGPINVTPCDSETCSGFLIQFGSIAKSQPVAEAQAFDGPAQITLHDGPNTPGQGFVWPAQPAAPQESIDDLADRLEREFLQRAVSGQLQVPATCPACDKEATSKEAAACKSGQCQSGNCQPGQCGLAACPGCPAGSPCNACCPAPGAMPAVALPSGTPSAALPAFNPRSQWTLPTPAVTINPYAQTSAIPTPGAGTVLPRDCDFYMRSPMEVPAGPPVGYPTPGHVPSTFAPAYPPMATPQVALGPQRPRLEWNPALNSPAQGSCATQGPCTAQGNCRTPANSYGAAPTQPRTPINGETLETYRDISRTLGQMAERCEAQGLYEQADELRDMAQEYRMSARIVHGHLSAMPLPQPVYGQLPQSMYGQMPMPYPVPATYYPDQAPSLELPQSPLVPAGYPQPQHQPLPIAQPMMTPRY